MAAPDTTCHAAFLHGAFSPLLPSLSGPPVFLSKFCCVRMEVCSSQERATEQCVAVPPACPFYLVPSPLGIGRELGPEQHDSQAQAS